MRKHIHQNIWGNWNGYLGTRRVEEFGLDERAAKDWLAKLEIPMTPGQAKKIIKATLDSMLLPYTKLTARTIHFTDLARGSCIFVKVHGWQPNPLWRALQTIAATNGFRVEESRQ